LRLSKKEIDLIKSNVQNIFGDASIYLFGSSVDDTRSGGDIDLYIIPKVTDSLFKKKIRVKTILEDILFKPVDIVLSKDKNRLIEKEAIKGIKL
jgi:predicted nucleotidyltransferase